MNETEWNLSLKGLNEVMITMSKAKNTVMINYHYQLDYI